MNEPYFEIGVYHAKREHNIGTLWRSALQLGASGVFTIGRRYVFQTSDTSHTGHSIPLKHYLTFDDFLAQRSDPTNTPLIGIEMGGVPLSGFSHPQRAIYLLGAEDYGLPAFVLEKCDAIVSLEAVGKLSYNLAVAGSIVMYHRCFLQAGD